MKKSLQLFTVSQPLNVIKLKSRVKTSVRPGKEARLSHCWLPDFFQMSQMGPRRVMKNKRSLNLPFLVIPGTCLGIFRQVFRVRLQSAFRGEAPVVTASYPYQVSRNN